MTLGSSGDTITTGYDNTDSPYSINLKQGSSTLLGFSYSDAPSGDVVTETDTGGSGGSPSYTYDPQGQLTSMTSGSTSSTYTPDASSNLKPIPADAAAPSPSANYDHAGELTASSGSAPTVAYGYNKDGELTTETQGSTIIGSAGWSGAGEVTSYNNSNATSGTGANMTTAAYNGEGERESETVTPQGGAAATEAFVNGESGAASGDILMDSNYAFIYNTGASALEQVSLADGTVNYLVSGSDGSGSVQVGVHQAWSHSESIEWAAKPHGETSGGCFYGFKRQPDTAATVYGGPLDDSGLCGPQLGSGPLQ